MGKTSFKSETTLTGEKEAKEGKDPFLALGRGVQGGPSFLWVLAFESWERPEGRVREGFFCGP